MLRWRLILKEYGTEIQYIPGATNIVAHSMSRLPSKEQPKYTHKFNYIMEALLEIYNVEELPNGVSPLKFATIDHYQL